MKTWKVIVEDSYGILATHYVTAVFASTAREMEEARGYLVLSVSPFHGEVPFYTAA